MPPESPHAARLRALIVEVLRLGKRVAQFKAADTNVEELVGAMTGALDGAA